MRRVLQAFVSALHCSRHSDQFVRRNACPACVDSIGGEGATTTCTKHFKDHTNASAIKNMQALGHRGNEQGTKHSEYHGLVAKQANGQKWAPWQQAWCQALVT
eukprot:1158599-Pelagomonas_calceolata.AAC.20